MIRKIFLTQPGKGNYLFTSWSFVFFCKKLCVVLELQNLLCVSPCDTCLRLSSTPRYAIRISLEEHGGGPFQGEANLQDPEFLELEYFKVVSVRALLVCSSCPA